MSRRRWTVATATAALERQGIYRPKPERAPTLDEMRAHVADVCSAYNVRIEIRERMPHGAGGFATGRRVVVPPLNSEEAFAVTLHEIGHVLSGRCSYKDPHLRDQSTRDSDTWHRCLQCERDAWRAAIGVSAPIPWTETMQRRMTESLTWCLQNIGASPRLVSQAHC